MDKDDDIYRLYDRDDPVRQLAEDARGYFLTTAIMGLIVGVAMVAGVFALIAFLLLR